VLFTCREQQGMMTAKACFIAVIILLGLA
jgi:hypothetical protein